MMDWLRGLFRRARTWVRPGAADRELREEMQLHTDLEAERLVREGMSPDDARRTALLAFGGMERYGEAARDARGSGWLDEARHDMRHAFRLVHRNPRFAAAIVLTLSLGIGANTAVFSVVDAVLLRAWPFADIDRLVMIWETDRSSGTTHEPASWPDVVDMRERSRTLESIGSVVSVQGTLIDDGRPERVGMLAVTPNVPDLLGVEPLIGRTFVEGEGAMTGAASGLLSEQYWQRRFAGRRDVIGSTLLINGRPTVIAGVLPHNADLGMTQVHARADYGSPLIGNVDVWVALEPSADVFPRETHPFLTIGRLRPDATLSLAQDELASIMSGLEGAFPENAARGVNLEHYEDVTFGPVRRALFVLLGGVALVLLVACVNVANLLLARSASRGREVAVRLAMGASRSRIRRQFLMESIVLTLLGTICGLLLAQGALASLTALAPPDIPRLADAVLDLRVLAIAATTSAAVCILFGMAPALRTGRFELQSVLKAQSGRSATDSRDGRRFRNSLVVAEVALAVMLVVAAGLLARSFQALTAVDPGFRTAGILEAAYQLEPASRYPMDFERWPEIPEITGFHDAFLERVRALPGVREAALASTSPLDAGITNSFAIVGREAESQDYPEIRTRFITPGYLTTMAVPLHAGRDLARSDIAGGEPVALINEAAADRYFDGHDPLDQYLRFWGVSWRIVGVIGNERFNGLDAAAQPAVYTSLAQAPQTAAVLLARTDGDPVAVVPGVRDILRELDPALALSGAQPLEQALAGTVARPRFLAVLLGMFAALATALALIGVHGVLSYSVTQRTPEVGIRLALGSTRAAVLRLIVSEGVTLAAIGTVLGLAAAAAAATTMRALLFGVGPLDTLTFVAVPVCVITLAALASWLPARRAARAQPMSALRTD